MINYSVGLAGFINYAILNVTGSEFILILLLLLLVVMVASMSFSIPFEITLSIVYSPLLVAAAYNSEFIKLLMLIVFYLSVLFMKFLTFNR